MPTVKNARALIHLILASVDHDVSESDTTTLTLPRDILVAKLEEFLSYKTEAERRAESKANMAAKRQAKEAEKQRIEKRKAEFADLRARGYSIPRQAYEYRDRSAK